MNYRRESILLLQNTKIAYYTTREVKRWPVQSTCKLPPEPKASFATSTFAPATATFAPAGLNMVTVNPFFKFKICKNRACVTKKQFL